MQTATLSSKYQICILKNIREEMHIEAGQQFVIIPKGTVLYLVPKYDIKKVRGFTK